VDRGGGGVVFGLNGVVGYAGTGVRASGLLQFDVVHQMFSLVGTSLELVLQSLQEDKTQVEVEIIIASYFLRFMSALTNISALVPRP
jgi:hypothetical protein